MTTEKILLRPDEGEKVTLTTYISYECRELNMPPRPAIVICPGGGYKWLSDREAEPIAKEFFARGFNCFILRYSVAEDAVFPRPLVEASRAVVHVRENAEKYNVDPEKVFIIGFSAGGHLAASLGTMWHEDFAKASDGMPYGLNRPTGMILCYPVITSGEFAHRGSFDSLLGTKTPTEEQNRAYSLEYRVSDKTVPAYICHSFEDVTVPVQNALFFMNAMAAAKVPFESHVFPFGPHGFSLANEEVSQGKVMPYAYLYEWLGEAIAWTKKM